MRFKKITLLLGIVMTIAVLSACHKKEKDEPVDIEVTPSPTITVTPEATAAVTPTLTPSPSAAEEDGKEPESEVKDEEDIENEEADDVELTEEEAADSIRKALEDESYTYELLDDHLNVSDRLYYIYQVSDEGKVALPNIIVDKVSGKVMCYGSDGKTSSITEHPLYHKSESSQPGKKTVKNEITKEEALKLLEKIPNKTLGLAKALSEYTVIYDDWITNVKGVDCYGINVYEKGDLKNTFAGAYYVATDGSRIYLYDVVKDKTIDITK